MMTEEQRKALAQHPGTGFRPTGYPVRALKVTRENHAMLSKCGVRTFIGVKGDARASVGGHLAFENDYMVLMPGGNWHVMSGGVFDEVFRPTPIWRSTGIILPYEYMAPRTTGEVSLRNGRGGAWQLYMRYSQIDALPSSSQGNEVSMPEESIAFPLVDITHGPLTLYVGVSGVREVLIASDTDLDYLQFGLTWDDKTWEDSDDDRN